MNVSEKVGTVQKRGGEEKIRAPLKYVTDLVNMVSQILLISPKGFFFLFFFFKKKKKEEEGRFRSR